MGLRGFDGLDGTGAGPSESSSTSAPSGSVSPPRTVFLATAFTVAATAPGSVPLPLISSVSGPGPQSWRCRPPLGRTSPAG